MSSLKGKRLILVVGVLVERNSQPVGLRIASGDLHVFAVFREVGFFVERNSQSAG
jgi:hypothetical protein